MRILSCILLAGFLLSGCTGPDPDVDVRYWELENSLVILGDNDGSSVINQGPHCSWMQFHEGKLSYQRTKDKPIPEHVLAHRWTGEIPEAATLGSGYEWSGSNGEFGRTFGDESMVEFSWVDGELWVDGKPAADGHSWIVEYSFQDESSGNMFEVRETLTLHDHGTVTMTIINQDQLSCL